MNRKSPTDQAEKAFAAYFNANIEGTVLQPYEGWAGHTLVPLPLGVNGQPTGFDSTGPANVIFQASSPVQLGYDSGIFEMQLKARLETDADTFQSTPGIDVHAAAMEALRDMLEDFATIYDWLNFYPEGGQPNFTNFGLSAIVYQGESPTQANDSRLQAMEDTYYICATVNQS